MNAHTQRKSKKVLDTMQQQQQQQEEAPKAQVATGSPIHNPNVNSHPLDSDGTSFRPLDLLAA
jgi:hypothetical protein